MNTKIYQCTLWMVKCKIYVSNENGKQLATVQKNKTRINKWFTTFSSVGIDSYKSIRLITFVFSNL